MQSNEWRELREKQSSQNSRSSNSNNNENNTGQRQVRIKNKNTNKKNNKMIKDSIDNVIIELDVMIMTKIIKIILRRAKILILVHYI